MTPVAASRSVWQLPATWRRSSRTMDWWPASARRRGSRAPPLRGPGGDRGAAEAGADDAETHGMNDPRLPGPRLVPAPGGLSVRAAPKAQVGLCKLASVAVGEGQRRRRSDAVAGAFGHGGDGRHVQQLDLVVHRLADPAALAEGGQAAADGF